VKIRPIRPEVHVEAFSAELTGLEPGGADKKNSDEVRFAGQPSGTPGKMSNVKCQM
jgi:hypothetical protein